jgi:hypothetical protein
MGGRGLSLSGSGWGLMVALCENSNTFFDFIKYEDPFNQLDDHQFLKKKSAAWS